MHHEVIVNTFEGNEKRLPPLDEKRAREVAELYKAAYPGALVEVAFRGIRRAL